MQIKIHNKLITKTSEEIQHLSTHKTANTRETMITKTILANRGKVVLRFGQSINLNSKLHDNKCVTCW